MFLDSPLSMKCSFNTSVDFNHTPQHYIPEDSTLHIIEEFMHKHLFHMLPAGKFKIGDLVMV
jgi:hypothetical protein